MHTGEMLPSSPATRVRPSYSVGPELNVNDGSHASLAKALRNHTPVPEVLDAK
jgi:hypothetical protein